MARWKKITITAALLIVVMIAAFYVILSLYDFNRFKPMIAKAVKEATGRELTIAGNIEFELGIRPTLVVEDAGFQNASWSSTPDLARVKRLEVQIAVLPLISGKFDFAHLVLIEPNVIVEFDRAGTSNFAFDTGPESTNDSAIPPPPLIFSDLLIEKGLFTYKDAQSGLEFTVSIDHLAAKIPGFDQSLQLNFAGAFDDKPFTLEGSVGPIWAWVESGYSLPADFTLTAAGATARVKGEIRDPTHFKDLAISIAAEGPSTAAVTRLGGQPDMPEFGPFKLAATLRDPQGPLAIEGLDVAIGSEALIAVTLTGDIKDVLALQGIQLKISGRGEDSANLTGLGLPPLPRQGAFSVSAEVTDLQSNVYSATNLSMVLGSNEINGKVTLNLAELVPYFAAELSAEKFELGPSSLNLHLTDPFNKPALKNIDLKLGTPELAAIKLNGAVDDLIELQGVNINFEADGKNLANLKQLTGQPLPVRGAFRASGQITAPDPKHLRIPNLKITAGKNDIAGSLDLDLRSDKPELTAVLSVPQLDLPSVLLPELAKQGWAEGLRQVRPLKLAAKLAGIDQGISVKELDLQAGALDSVEVRLNGSVENLVSLRGVDLKFSVQGNEQAKLKEILAQPYLFAPVPGQGVYAVSGNIRDQAADIFNVSNFKFVLAENELTGRVNVNLAAQPPQYEVDLSAPKFNLKPFPIPKEAAYASLNKIDDLGPLKIQSKVIVKDDQLSLSQFELQAGREQLAVLQVKGSIKDLTTQRGIDLQFDIRGNEVANLAQITDLSLPLKGTYALSGKLTDPAQKQYKIGELAFKLGANDITGWLDLNLSGKQLQLATELAAPKFTLQPVILPALETLSRFEDLGPLKLALNLSAAGNTLALNNLDLLVGSEEIIRLLIKGTVSDLSALQGMNLAFSVKGQDISKVTAAGGPQMDSKGAFHVSGQFSDPAPKVYKLPAFEAAWGDSQSSGWLELDTTGQRPRLKAELSSDKLDLRPFLKQPQNTETAETQAAKTVAAKKDKPKTKTPSPKPATQKARVFPADPLPLAPLQQIDAEVKFRGKEVLLRTMALNDIAVDALLNNGDLDIKPLKLTIGGGKAEGSINLKSLTKPAELTTTLTVEQLAIGPMLEQLDYPRSIEGNLDTVIDLGGTGDSVAALMAKLNGTIRIYVIDGKAESKYLDLLAKYLGSGILQMLNPLEEKRKYTPIHCYVNSVEIEEGLADVKILLDTDRTSIFGAGEINLKTEGLNLGIKPTPQKSALPADISFNLGQLSQPFRLGGTLADPLLAIDPGRSAFVIAEMAGALALGPIGIAAFFADVSIGKKDPCAVAKEALDRKGQPSGAEKAEAPSKEPPAGDQKKKEEKSGGFFKRLFGK